MLLLLVWKKKLSAQEVQDLVRGERNVPLIIDFYATWCGPCILMAQELEMVGSNLMSCCGLVLILCHFWVFILINFSRLRSIFVEGNSLLHKKGDDGCRCCKYISLEQVSAGSSEWKCSSMNRLLLGVSFIRPQPLF